ncbi:hypothetical protein K438DRAFT_1785263 [Mycena galopus ATCC 62051]|nr:hypothetical protein K438DRAFT_1785263 [Mycena galopus ATCC 62051]
MGPSGLRVRVNSTLAKPKNEALPIPPTPVLSAPTAAYPHVSCYRSPTMELLLYSPDVKVVVRGASGVADTLPVFGASDVVSGKLILHPSCQAGRLVLTIEGAFTYNCPWSHGRPPEKQRHVLFSSSKIIQVHSSSDFDVPRSTFLDVFAIKRRPSGSDLRSSVFESRSYSFAWELPQSEQLNDEIPSTFSAVGSPFEVTYQVSATWESVNMTENPSVLEVPIALQPDPVVRSLDADDDLSSWLEIPLKSDRPTSFQCAVTLPVSATFSRASDSISYFVVFTTTPRSQTLAREIASDATIAVSLCSRVTITADAAVALPIVDTPPQTPLSTKSQAAESPLTLQPGTKLFSRLSWWSQGGGGEDAKSQPLPLPLPPPESPAESRPVFSAVQTVQSSMCIGFTKRARHQQSGGSVSGQLPLPALPDGLHKSTIPLDQDIPPSINWGGVAVEYYMDISVLFGQEELRERVPLRII